MFRNLAASAICLAVLVLVPPLSQADTISLAWDPVSHPTLDGYRVYYGTSPGNYSQTLDVGLNTNAVLSGLTSCTDYSIALKAVASDGQESTLFSNEVSGWARPIVSAASPGQLQQGSTVDVVVTGANFRNGIALTTSNPGLTLNTLTINGCNQLTANVTIASNASLGALDLTVTDAGGIVGVGTGLTSVTGDTTAPTISAVQSSAVGSTTATISWNTDEPASGQVFYRPVGETVYQVGRLDAALTTAHTASLTGLNPSTTYEYYVESIDGNGNAATGNGPSTWATPSNSFTYLRFEPENGPIGSPAEVLSGADAFGDAWLQLQQGTASGSVSNPAGTWDYGFSVPSAGTWFVWLRLYGVNGNANAWFESVDGSSFAVAETTANGEWQWIAARSQSLSAGQHQLTLGGAEARARIDRVLITDDPSFLPSEQPGGDVVAPGAVTSLTTTEGDTEVTLGWTNPSAADLSRVVVRFRTDGVIPVSPIDGQGLIDRAAVGGASDGVTHTGLTNGTTVSYAVFAVDAAGNVSPAASVAATPDNQQAPPPPQVQNLVRTDDQ